MKIRPLGDRILVKRIEEEEKSKGGIIIPDSAKEKPQEGKVVAVGKGKISDEGKVIPMEIKPYLCASLVKLVRFPIDSF